MKRRITTRDRIIGCAGAFLLSLIFLFLNNNPTGLSQVFFWILVGPIILLVMLFVYFISTIIVKEDYDEEKKMEYRSDFKATIIGIFVWFIIMVLTYLLNMEFSQYANEFGGLVTILVVIVYMRKKSNIPIL